MKAYHITKNENLESILKGGLNTGNGIDGPGVYVYKGPLNTAIREADLSLRDSWYQLSEKEINTKLSHLRILKFDYDESEEISVSWPEYLVFKNPIAPNRIKIIEGNFLELLNKYFSKL